MLKKIRLAVDEDSPYLELQKRLGKNIRIIPVTTLAGRYGADDNIIYQICCDKNYHLITRNTRHFKKFLRDTTKRAGIICNEASNFKSYFEQLEKLFNLLGSHQKLQDKFIRITGTHISIIDKRSKERIIIR